MRRDPSETRLLLVTCEHGGREVPVRWRRCFRGHAAALRSHRGFDPGAKAIAERLAVRLAAPLVASTTTRLLVDLNRSIGHPKLFGPTIRGLAPSELATILTTHYHPYRRTIERFVADANAADRAVVHVAVHTCVDELDGRVRDLDVALLFDPSRAAEADLARRWRGGLRRLAPDGRYPFNRPYRGTSDGLTTSLRARHVDPVYAGIEVEVRQGLLPRRSDAVRWADRLAAALGEAIIETDDQAGLRTGGRKSVGMQTGDRRGSDLGT